jgi:hypothetical protein
LVYALGDDRPTERTLTSEVFSFTKWVVAFGATVTVPYLVQVTIDNLNIRKGAGTNYVKTGKYTGKGTFTIVEDETGTGSIKGWGKLKFGAGWISLDYATRV